MEICWNCYFLAFLDGSYIEDSFSGHKILPEKFSRYPYLGALFLLIVQAAFLSIEICICDFFVNFWKWGCLLGIFVGYLLGGLFSRVKIPTLKTIVWL